jgi:hypothetical protein
MPYGLEDVSSSLDINQKTIRKEVYKVIKRVTFVDEGQDFLTWDIDYPDDDSIVGKVVDCKPYQYDIWVGTEVFQRDINSDDLLLIVLHPEGKPRPCNLIHPVESVEEIKQEEVKSG